MVFNYLLVYLLRILYYYRGLVLKPRSTVPMTKHTAVTAAKTIWLHFFAKEAKHDHPLFSFPYAFLAGLSCAVTVCFLWVSPIALWGIPPFSFHPEQIGLRDLQHGSGAKWPARCWAETF